jgi:hypothetical protein
MGKPSLLTPLRLYFIKQIIVQSVLKIVHGD